MVATLCIVCGRGELEVDILHHFPKKLEWNCEWLDAIGCKTKSSKPISWRICNLHFDEECYKESPCRRLQNHAVPSLLLPTMSRFSCIVCEKRGDEVKSIHKFPVAVHRKLIWQKAIGFETEHIICDSWKICNFHFTEDSFLDSSCNRLKREAVPSLLLKSPKIEDVDLKKISAVPVSDKICTPTDVSAPSSLDSKLATPAAIEQILIEDSPTAKVFEDSSGLVNAAMPDPLSIFSVPKDQYSLKIIRKWRRKYEETLQINQELKSKLIACKRQIKKFHDYEKKYKATADENKEIKVELDFCKFKINALENELFRIKKLIFQKSAKIPNGK